MTTVRSTFVLTGLPRGGTTYLSALLYNPPHVITISDPQGTFRRFFKENGVDRSILDLIADFRRQIEMGEPIPTLDGTDGFLGKGKVDTWNQKKILRTVDAAPDFALGMKNPEVFLAHLPIFLDAGMRCVVSVRHPLSILNSWRRRTLDQVASDGGSPRGFGAGIALGFESTATDPLRRAIALHEHYAAMILRHADHPLLLRVRHEDWYRDPTQLARVANFLEVDSLGYLRPAPIPPTPTSLDPAEEDAILRGCLSAAEFGYTVRSNRLLAPSDRESLL